MILRPVILRALILAATVALPQAGQAAPPDGRIRQLPYEADQVVTLSVSPGYAAVVELAPGEAILNVVVGDSSGWQVTQNSSADRVIVKPLGDAATTNMIVVTDVRRYILLLDANGHDGQGVFVLKFSYPNAPQPTAVRSVASATYKLRGAKSLFPAAMRDDGERTIITWKDQTALPAVFALTDDGEEAIVNGRMIGGDYVIEGTASKYVFRLGDARAIASRKTVHAP